jgi:hypothetical protein
MNGITGYALSFCYRNRHVDCHSRESGNPRTRCAVGHLCFQRLYVLSKATALSVISTGGTPEAGRSGEIWRRTSRVYRCGQGHRLLYTE